MAFFINRLIIDEVPKTVKYKLNTLAAIDFFMAVG
jgi:hypothetical protein